MNKILFIHYQESWEVLDKESDITQDHLKDVDEGEAELVRYSEKAGGIYEQAIVTSETTSEEEDGPEETTYEIAFWRPVSQ